MKRAFLNRLLLVNYEFQFNLLDFSWFKRFPDRFDLINLVALIVVKELVEKDEQGSRCNAACVFVALFKELDEAILSHIAKK